METKTIFYWISTLAIGSETLAGGFIDLIHGRSGLVSGPYVLDMITHLGYPAYLLTILGVWKVLAGIVLFTPGIPLLKEWAYAGLFFELTGAAASWALHGDPAGQLIPPVFLTILVLSSWALRPPDRTLAHAVPRWSPNQHRPQGPPPGRSK